MYYLGMMYRDGEGVEKSLDNALSWWKKATRGGHQGAAFAMSEFKASTKTMF
ncbi:MAG: SEL1-like repeat protein [Campylobacterales bacterium]|nr:SEL1-like repeat protein [Campylobacterales bacterium]